MKKIIKRGISYLIDITIVFLIIILLNAVIPKTEEYFNIQSQINSINEDMMKENINFSTYFNEYSHLIYELDKNSILEYIVILIVIHIYFIFIPYLTGGKTLGMYFLHLKVVGKSMDKISLMGLWIRNFIWNGIFYYLLLFICLILLKDRIYFISTIILGIIQILLVIISIFMIIYRKDCRGLHDIFSNTKIKEEV